MALSPIFQPRRISPRQKIESRCGWRNWPPAKTLVVAEVAVHPAAVIPTGAKRSGGTCFPLGRKYCRLAVMLSEDGGEPCRQLGTKTSMWRPRDLLPTTGPSTALAALRFGRDDSANIHTLPVRDGTVRAEVGLRAGRHRFRDFGDLGQLLEVELNSQARPLVGIELAVLEIQANRQMRQRPSLVVVLHQDGAARKFPGSSPAPRSRWVR